ncbi:MAG TPA: nuclear transport factor 2 family protein [Steroidobacteraceae bacterium]|nr:nuclear transport factor 2 family protein [Steroidobacteraceae bacterium]
MQGHTMGAAGLAAQLVAMMLGAAGMQQAAAAAGGAPDLAALEQRAQAVQDIEQIKRLQRAYGYYLDRSDWDDVLDLLTDDVTMEYGTSGVYVGKAHARALLYAIGYGHAGLNPQQLREHLQLQPVITLSADGLTARGRWRALVLLGQFKQYARWQTGPYENEYRKEHGVWKISAIHWVETFTVPFEGGWKTSMAQSNVADRRLPPPDRPPTFDYRPWPAVSLPPYHYRPDEVAPEAAGAAHRHGRGASAGESAAPAAAGSVSVHEEALRVATLRQKIDRLDDARQIEILQRTYGYYVDKNLWQQIADLYTEDGTLEIGGRGVFVGRARVLQYLQWLGKPRSGLLYDHTQMQPIIDVAPDGLTAKGRWRALVFGGGFTTDGRSGTSVLGDCIYENQYRKEHGVWKIARLHAYFIMYTTMDRGWGVYAIPNTRPEKTLPPDLPPTVVYEMYPGKLTAPLHYGNPVTGARVYPPAPPPVTGTPTRAQLSAELSALAKKLAVLEDTQAIENLQDAYGYYLDKWQWSDAASLFARQGASIELAGRGVYLGRDRIRASLADAFGAEGLHQGEVNDHPFYQDVIHIAPDGLTARARVRELAILGKFGVEALIGGGVRENEYVKEDGVWRIKSDHLYQTFLADYSKGWSAGALPQPGPSTTLPPDRPPSSSYQPFPAFEPVPFDYPNPVTGRWVQVQAVP